ncbi:MAG: M28 family peptidase [Bacteroidota bacterium]
MKTILPILCCCLFAVLHAQNTYPIISNLVVQYDETAEILTITYDLEDDDSELDVVFQVSDNNGQSFLIPTENASGDVGLPVQPGTNKTISWDASGRLSGAMNYQIKLVADDLFEIDIQEIVDQVDSNRMRNNLEFIGDPRNRFTSADHLEEVKDSIENAFLAANLNTYRDDVPFGGYTGENILGDWAGTTQSEFTYIIDAHFDTVNGSPGADDNGSGVVGFLEALRVLSPYRFNKTIRFIGFDLEEDGLIGANNYVFTSLPEGETIEGVFNLEMIGYFSEEPNSQTFPTGFELLYPEEAAVLAADQFRGNFVNSIGDQNSGALKDAYDSAVVTYVPELKIISFLAPPNWQVITPDFGRSDHAPFWEEGIPALMLTDGSNFRNPFYHSADDVVETLNFTFMSNVVKAVVGAVAELANIEHSTVATSAFMVTTSVSNALDCQFQLSPVPAAENLKLVFTDCTFDEVQLQLFDISGQLVKQSIATPNATGDIDLNISALDAGVYVLKINQEGRSVSKKLVID